MIFGLEKFWLQFVAPLIGVLWFVYYWIRHHADWSWKREMPILILVSILTMSYGWTYDYVLLLFVIVFLLIRLLDLNQKKLTISLIVLLAVINLVYLVMMRNFTDGYFGWFAPAVFIWFLISTKYIYRVSMDNA